MNSHEQTVQQRDPIAALIARSASFLAAIAVPLFAAGTTWFGRDSIESPALALLALFFVVLASVDLVVQSSPLRAPLTSHTHAIVVGSALVALLLSALSMGESDAYLRDDWGGPVVGLFIVALAPYRPARELLVSGVLSAIFAGFIAVVQSDSFVTVAPVGGFVIVAVTPIIAMSLAAAAFVTVLVRSLDRWRVRADRAFTAMTGERGESIARSVQQDSVTVLNQEVVPLFTALLDGALVDDSTRERARQISAEVRALMIADVDCTWLESVVDQVGNGVPGAASTVVRDEHRLAEHMSTDERTAVRAFVVALHDAPSFDDETVEISIVRDGSRCEVVLRATVDSELNVLKGPLAPFLAVIRVMFSDLQVDHEQPALTLRFSYEQR